MLKSHHVNAGTNISWPIFLRWEITGLVLMMIVMIYEFSNPLHIMSVNDEYFKNINE